MRLPLNGHLLIDCCDSVASTSFVALIGLLLEKNLSLELLFEALDGFKYLPV
jgi:hypothetical protein